MLISEIWYSCIFKIFYTILDMLFSSCGAAVWNENILCSELPSEKTIKIMENYSDFSLKPNADFTLYDDKMAHVLEMSWDVSSLATESLMLHSDPNSILLVLQNNGS